MSIRNFVLLFGLISLIQALFTPIAKDEAYYYMFGQDLDWGYFDHPPMVALMTYLGSFISNGIVGVRIITVLMGMGLVWNIWMMVPEEIRIKNQIWIFALLILLNPLFNVYGFITTPDMPLLFFSAVFLRYYQQFIDRPDFKNSLISGALMAALIYSKYHGVLVIGFAVLSNLKLFKSPYLYLAGVFGLLLYVPHILWQYQHDFVSFEYHLFYRSRQFKMENFYMFIINAFVVFNPFLFSIFIRSFFKGNERRQSNRLMNFMFWGFMSFFGFSSLRGHVEPHWLAVACIPLTIYLMRVIDLNQAYHRFFKISSVITIALLMGLRVAIAFPNLPINSEFHRRGEAFHREMDSLSEGREIIIVNSYTEASKSHFYNKRPSFSYNTVQFRKNQYDLQPSRDEMYVRDVMLVTLYSRGDATKVELKNKDSFYYTFKDSLALVNLLKMKVLQSETTFQKGDTVPVDILIKNDHAFDVDLEHSGDELTWGIFFFWMDKERIHPKDFIEQPKGILKSGDSLRFSTSFIVDLDVGDYTFGPTVHPNRMARLSQGKRTYSIKVTQ